MSSYRKPWETTLLVVAIFLLLLATCGCVGMGKYNVRSQYGGFIVHECIKLPPEQARDYQYDCEVYTMYKFNGSFYKSKIFHVFGDRWWPQGKTVNSFSDEEIDKIVERRLKARISYYEKN